MQQRENRSCSYLTAVCGIILYLYVMKRKWSLTVFLIVVLFVIGGYFIYEKYLKVKIKNVTPKELVIKLNDQKSDYVISKHSNQESIFQLELTIQGKSTEFITLYIGEKPTVFTTQIRLKDGPISTAHICDWYSDSAYVKVEKSAKADGEIRLEYQFLSMK